MVSRRKVAKSFFSEAKEVARGRKRASLPHPAGTMNIHEYQAKELFEKFGVPSPQGQVADTAAEAKAVAEKIGNGN